MLKPFPRLASAGAATAAALAISAGAVGAAETNLRIQTHFSPETLSGKMSASRLKNTTRCHSVRSCRSPLCRSRHESVVASEMLVTALPLAV